MRNNYIFINQISFDLFYLSTYSLLYIKDLWLKYCNYFFISESHISGDVTGVEMIVYEIDWRSAWSKKYPILASYQGIKEINTYSKKISELYDTFKDEFKFNDTDTVLVLKDILYQKYKMTKNNTN